MKKVHAGLRGPICGCKGKEAIFTINMARINCKKCLEVLAYRMARQHKPFTDSAPQPRAYYDGTRKGGE